MFLTPLEPETKPGKRAWDNLILHEEGRFVAFFATATPSESNPHGRPITLDIAVSDDGLKWRWIAREAVELPGAHAGYGVHRVGDRYYYYPTCSRDGSPVHFKIFESTDLVHWHHLGDDHDVTFDPRWYRARWDELLVLEQVENGETVLYGYISSEVREDVGPPSVGLLRSRDGRRWDVLPPPVIEWGELPAQDMELNFCEEIDGRYYLGLSGRFYLDSYGYSIYVFVGDSPSGPFRPDLERFRLTGTSRRNITWLGHTLHVEDDLLLALWLSTGQHHDLPSDNFTVGPLKRLVCEDGHLRLRYWPGNERGKGDPLLLRSDALVRVHPDPLVRNERDSIEVGDGGIRVSASRDGVIAIFEATFEANVGFVLEGRLTALENRGGIATHQHAAAAGLFFESGGGEGLAILPDTLGVTRTGYLRYARHSLTEEDPYAHAGKGLTQGRSGVLRGTCAFHCEDTVGPFGHAAYAGIRHGRSHAFRILGKGRFFEFYIDDLYVQAYCLPETFTGRIGLVVFDGQCTFEGLCAWRMEPTETGQ